MGSVSDGPSPTEQVGYPWQLRRKQYVTQGATQEPVQVFHPGSQAMWLQPSQ